MALEAGLQASTIDDDIPKKFTVRPELVEGYGEQIADDQRDSRQHANDLVCTFSSPSLPFDTLRANGVFWRTFAVIITRTMHAQRGK
jgi:hypothetical protein